jgi:Skp family chaperone for outer membrane proteins
MEVRPMKHLALAMFVAIGGLMGFPVGAPGADAAEATPIALVNVDRILTTHKPLIEKLEPLKSAAKELDAAVQVRQTELEKVGNQFRSAPPGSPEQQRLQLQFVKLQTELQQFIANEQQAQHKKQAAVYVTFFRQLDAEISKYAKAHGIKLVLRQHATSYDEGQPLQEILKALNRAILYEDGLDITDEILKSLEATTADTGRER